MTDNEKDDLISEAEAIMQGLIDGAVNGSNMMVVLFTFLQLAVKADQWKAKRARIAWRDRQEQKP